MSHASETVFHPPLTGGRKVSSLKSRTKGNAGIAGHSRQSRQWKGLTNCDTSFNRGCNGGRMDRAYEFIINNGGIDTEEDYPYEGYQDTCDESQRETKVVTIDDYENIPADNETVLQTAVANQLVSVSVDASSLHFQFYSSVRINTTRLK